jgi:predicted nucleotidyltransferase
MEFERLVKDRLPAPLRGITADLVRRKRAGEELDDGPRIPPLHAFLDSEIKRLGAGLPAKTRRRPPDWDALDKVLRNSLGEVWGNPLPRRGRR